MTGVIEAKERRKVITLDVPNTFVQTRVEDKKDRIALTLRGLAVDLLTEIEPKYAEYVETTNGKKVLCLECTNVICGTVKAALLFHNKFRNDIKNWFQD